MVMGSDIYNLRGVMNNEPNALFDFESVEPNQSEGTMNASTRTASSSDVGSAAPSNNTERYISEDPEIFSDIVLSYIDRMLMEEDIDEKLDMFQGHPAFEATAKPFYEILASSPDQLPHDASHSLESSYGNSSGNSHDAGVNNGVVDSNWAYDTVELASLQSYPFSIGSFNSTNNGKREPQVIDAEASDLFSESMFALQFRRGVEEARKFLPSDDNVDKLVINLEGNGFSLPRAMKRENGLDEVKAESEEREFLTYGSVGRKTRHGDELDLEEGRNTKQPANYNSEETLRSKMFDMVLLCPGENCDKGVSALREAMQNKVKKDSKNGLLKGSGGGRTRRKKQSKSEVVDLRTLLIHCAQAVADDDRRSANEILKQIRHHSSHIGDGTQRLANYFADGLEARLAGTGSQKDQSFVLKQVSATDILKAYWLYMAACPFRRASHFFTIQTIMDVTETASRVHVIDIGIYFGFQWPTLIWRLSTRPGGPPKLRITGIDLPQPGFRPAARIEETGRRLAEYARSFNVPFEYRAIAAKLETIEVKDLNIDKDEVLVVNSMYRFQNLLDETVVADCPRNKLLDTIRRINPKVFIQGAANGSYSAPFFITRFREAMFHFSALFDMLETNVPREDPQRLLIERDIFGRKVLNVIACEGPERVERPESYKQWQVRNHRAGFVQLPLNPNIVEKITQKVKEHYHKDFVIDQDSQWLLQGWKGRIICALSVWKPNSV